MLATRELINRSFWTHVGPRAGQLSHQPLETEHVGGEARDVLGPGRQEASEIVTLSDSLSRSASVTGESVSQSPATVAV